MRWVYISPHLDDAVFSVGGLMHEQRRAGDRVAIWTVMCGVPVTSAALSPLAIYLHQAWGTHSPEAALSQRRRENEVATHVIGAESAEFDFLDCIYRIGPEGEPVYQSVFARPHAIDAAVPSQIAQAIDSLLSDDDVPVFPLSVGRHVDHVLVRKAAGLMRRPARYYAELPYLMNQKWRLPLSTMTMRDSPFRISAESLSVWQEASRAYASQIAVEFGSPERMANMIAAYAQQRGGIRLWQ